MNKILSIVNPYIRYSPVTAAVFSILPIHEKYPVWFVNQYSYFHICTYDGEDPYSRYVTGLEIILSKLYKHIPSDKIPGLRVNCIEKKLVKKHINKDLCKFIKDMIVENKYILTFVNGKYIPQYGIDEDFLHPMFIFGYDDNKDIFYTKDYFKGIYKTAEIEGANLEKALENAKDEYLSHVDYLEGILIYEKGVYDQFEDQDDKGQLKDAILNAIKWMVDPDKSYLTGLICKKGDKKTGGISSYDLIIGQLDRESKNFLHSMNFKPLYTLMEHKYVLDVGLKHLLNTNCITGEEYSQFNEIKSKTKITFNKYIYSYIKNEVSILNEVKENIKDIGNKEMKLYSGILKNNV